MSKKLLSINIYYSPQSFGGATIVAEEVNQIMASEHSWNVLVVTTHNDASMPFYSLRRYSYNDVSVISINTPVGLSYTDEVNNQEVNELLSSIISAFRPDITHVHSTQQLGCGYFGHVKASGSALVVTVHDCWWICEKQFMINANGKYCFQESIDLDVCRQCVSDYSKYKRRLEFQENMLSHADLLLAPSAFQKDLYEKNLNFSVPIAVNKNGIKLPTENYVKNKRSSKTVFGFVGGPGPIKGAELIIDAFNLLGSRDDYCLYVVDAAQNVGSTWNDPKTWNIEGELEFVPPYTQVSMDEFFSQIDVLLFPSQWKESFGLTVREALVRNVWVISTEAGGVVEDIVNGVNGEIIPLVSDATALSEAMERSIQRKDWDAYQNTFSGDIRDYPGQAKELNEFFDNLLLDRSGQS